MSIIENLNSVIEEHLQLSKVLDLHQLKDAYTLCTKANRIFFSGMGRSGNMVKALAIRFMHLGYHAYVAGDASTPSIQKDDLLIAVTASAKTKVTLNHIETAKKQGASVLLISAVLEDPIGADCFLCIPAKTKIKTSQHAGSLFEQAVLLIGDSIAAEIIKEKNITTEFMNNRHANLQ